jgi:GNAT superfamily N-acetyltransferase
MFLTDREDWLAIGRVHGEFFREHPPVATMVVVAGLLDPAWKVEVEAEASADPFVRDASEEDRAWIRSCAQALFGAPVVVSRGKLHEPAALPAVVAVEGDERIGLATWAIEGGRCELVTIDALKPRRGVGSALLAAVEGRARAAGCDGLWLITTNDNLDALRFYQRRGFSIRAVHPDALRRSRALKPQIPEIGQYGIPVRDEIELEKRLES